MLPFLNLQSTENLSAMACSVNRSLRCPICQGALVSARSPEFALGCPKCRETYPIVNGIPRMISSGDAAGARRRKFAREAGGD